MFLANQRSAFGDFRGRLLLMAVMLLIACSGCTSIMSGYNSGSIQASLIQTAVQTGVQLAIAHQPEASRAQLAQEIILAATALEGVVEDGQLNASQLDTQLSQLLDRSGLPNATKSVLTSVGALIGQQLIAKVQKGVLRSGAQTGILTVLGWVVQGARPFAGDSPAVMAALHAGEQLAAQVRAGRSDQVAWVALQRVQGSDPMSGAIIQDNGIRGATVPELQQDDRIRVHYPARSRLIGLYQVYPGEEVFSAGDIRLSMRLRVPFYMRMPDGRVRVYRPGSTPTQPVRWGSSLVQVSRGDAVNGALLASAAAGT